MDEFGICPLRPTPRGWIELVRKDTHGNRDGDDAFDSEKRRQLVLPVETGPGNRPVRQPGDRVVVEDVLSPAAFGLSIEHPPDPFVTARVGSEDTCPKSDGVTREYV